ncbi:MAG: hypothetical protein ACREEE_05730, partial [Dongiaceae bacterium]
VDSIDHNELFKRTKTSYARLKNPWKGYIRDLIDLAELGTIQLIAKRKLKTFAVSVLPEWPMKITETEFFERVQQLPKTKTHHFLK